MESLVEISPAVLENSPFLQMFKNADFLCGFYRLVQNLFRQK